MNPVVSSSILKEGLVISTRLGSNTAWHKNIVYKGDESIISIALLDSYIEGIVLKGTKIILKHTNEFFEYLFEGTVSDIEPCFPAHISVAVHKAEELVNTRTFPRYDTYLSSEVKTSWDETKHFSIVTNICLGGVAFISKHEFDYGEESDVWVFLPQNQVTFGKGKVIRKSEKSGYFNYSMQFTDMTEENSAILSNYLVSMDEAISALQSHFFENIKCHL